MNRAIILILFVFISFGCKEEVQTTTVVEKVNEGDVPAKEVEIKGIYVSIAGDDLIGRGDKDSPFKTIAKGIAEAKVKELSNVFVAEGHYTEAVKLVSGINLYGGYSADDWEYDVDKHVTSIEAGPQGVVCNKKIEVVFSGFTVLAARAIGPGTSSYAMRINQCEHITITKNSFVALDGADGISGANGAIGMDGLRGQNGLNGGYGVVDPGYPEGGFGGGGANPGGRGADGGYDGLTGDNGAGIFGGSGGHGGHGGDDGDHGSSGLSGINGIHGLGGFSIGEMTLSGYTSADGQTGGDGLAGSGGGGGGSGSAQVFLPVTAYGCSGGGGGGGGFPGVGGIGGQGGGGSFAIWITNSQEIIIDENRIQAGNGGHGGNGGRGGNGGYGGTGGRGGQILDSEVARLGDGGDGGRGGNGGNGGHGGGGGGGPSVGIAKDVASQVAQINNRFLLGSSGLGGDSLESPGLEGVVSDVFTFLAKIELSSREIGDACESDQECDSGICVGVCSQACVDQCPDGFSCQATKRDVDLEFLCLP